MMIYSCLLGVALVVSSPWWIWRMATSGRYRAGLRGRLGAVPAELIRAVQGRNVIWLHAVSVGEVLAAEQLIVELKEALPGWVVAVSTTTAAGQRMARERLRGTPVFYMPLDFAYTMRRYLEALRPKLLILMESELWPRMLTECARAGIPVVVANARVSDRSFPRYMRLRRFWLPILSKVSLFLPQGEESGERLAKIGVDRGRIRVVGNLKYDAPVSDKNNIVGRLRENLPVAAEFVVCGSTLEGEEKAILEAWAKLTSSGHGAVLMIAPRHPQRFEAVVRMVGPKAVRMSAWVKAPRRFELGEVLVLDSIGSLAAIYQVATVAFLGGSLVPKGGHNPLEPARFGVPVVMGPSYENFREIVEGMRAADAITIVEDGNLMLALHLAMTRGRAMGRRGKEFFEAEAGATRRTVAALLPMVRGY